MRYILLFLLNIIFYVSGYAQSLKSVYEGKVYYSFCVKSNSENIKKFSLVENTNGDTHQNFVSKNLTNEMFASNASVVGDNCVPLGYYSLQGVLKQTTNLSDGNGNFFLKPNGAFLITNNDIVVCQASEISKYSNAIFGIQTGPMLVTNGIINPNFNIGSPNKLVRSGVGTFTNNKGEKFVVFTIASEPVSFYEFSLFFINKFNCKNALCIESSRSVMSIPYLRNTTDQSSEIICRYIVFDYAKK